MFLLVAAILSHDIINVNNLLVIEHRTIESLLKGICFLLSLALLRSSVTLTLHSAILFGAGDNSFNFAEISFKILIHFQFGLEVWICEHENPKVFCITQTVQVVLQMEL